MKVLLTVSGERLPEIIASAAAQFAYFFASYSYDIAVLAARPSAHSANYGGVGKVLAWEVDFQAETNPDIAPKDDA